MPSTRRVPRSGGKPASYTANRNFNVKVLRTLPLGPPPRTVDTAIFEMWLGSLSPHRGLSIPVL